MFNDLINKIENYTNVFKFALGFFISYKLSQTFEQMNKKRK
jgi:hypothetical protein